MKIVLNSCYGGFGLSDKAIARLEELGVKATTFGREVPRHDPRLVQVVEELGAGADGDYAQLRIEEIGGTLYRIDEYDGMEGVQTPDTMDWINASEA